MKRSLVVALLALAALLSVTPRSSPLAAQALPSPTEFEPANADWRSWRASRLSIDTSWLTLIGLHWLEAGDNLLGSAPGSRLPLPADKAPARAAVLRLEAGKVTLIPEPGVALTVGGQPVNAPRQLVTDAEADEDNELTLVELGSLNFYVLVRGDKVGLRLRDREARLLREFHGLDYFPADPAYRCEATFTANPPGTTVPVVNVLGLTDEMPSPGTLTFTLVGRQFTITALDDTGDGRLFLIFSDQTNGYETYGAGRFLYSDPPQDGKTIIDFNRAYNPPCAFTPWSTCQLPPRENKLPLRIEAGEKKFTGGHS